MQSRYRGSKEVMKIIEYEIIKKGITGKGTYCIECPGCGQLQGYFEEHLVVDGAWYYCNVCQCEFKIHIREDKQ